MSELLNENKDYFEIRFRAVNKFGVLYTHDGKETKFPIYQKYITSLEDLCEGEKKEFLNQYYEMKKKLNFIKIVTDFQLKDFEKFNL